MSTETPIAIANRAITSAKDATDAVTQLRAAIVKLQTDNFNLEAERDQLRAEIAELRAGRGRWPKLGPAVAPTVPRVITADELESGAKVATFTDRGGPVAGTVIGEATGNVRLLLHNDNLVRLDTERTFILLEDAPDEQQEPERRGEVAQPEDLRCGDIADVWAGDKIIFDASEVKTVTADNVWFRDQEYDGIPCTTRAGHEFRLISRSIPAPVTAETIRASEPGTVWRDRNGDKHEWTGERLAWHRRAGGLGKGDFLTNGGFEEDGPWSRSTAAPRGDYDTPKTEPETVTAETIRASKPGATFHSKGGASVYEWTGERLVVQGEESGKCVLKGVTGRNLWRSTAAPRGDYSTPPRLTVHKLNVAPVGSVLRRGSILKPMQKAHSGKWVKVGDKLMHLRLEWSSEDLIANGWADATLIYPEDQS